MTLNEIHDGRLTNAGTAVLPGGLTVNEIVEDLKLFPDSKHLTVHKNNLGSPYVAFEAESDIIRALAGRDIVNAFRRVVLDPVQGLVMLMTPSARHEGLKEELDEVVKAVATQLGVKKINLHSTRWKSESGDKNTGGEADNCYYLGNKVSDYDDACDEGSDEAFVGQNPPDLVVEVTISNFDDKKIAAYRSLGVSEYWQVKGGSKAREADEATFLDLQGHPAPVPLSASGVLAGFTPSALLDSLRIRSSRYDDPWDYGSAIRQVLIDHNIIPTEDNDGGGTLPPP